MIDTYGPSTRIIDFDKMQLFGTSKVSDLKVDSFMTLKPDYDGRTRVYIVRERFPTYIIVEQVKGPAVGP